MADRTGPSPYVDLDRTERRYRRIYAVLVFFRCWQQLITLFAVPFLLLWSPFLLYAAYFGDGAVRERIGVPLAFAFGLALLLFFSDAVVRKAGKAAGTVSLIFGMVIAFSWLDGAVHLEHAARVISSLSGASFALAAAVATVVVLVVMFSAHVAWVILRGAFALFRATPLERPMLRESHVGSRSLRAFLHRFWGLPPALLYVRGQPLRYVAILLLSSFSAFSFGYFGAFVALWPMILQQISAIDQRCDGGIECLRAELANTLLIGGLILPAILLAFLVVGSVSRTLSRRLMRLSLDDMLKVDERGPILFLRAFVDDRVPLQPARLPFFARMMEVGRRKTTLDQMLLEEATPYGPVVGLGNPRDKRPPYGAARGYFDDKNWQDGVADLSRISAAIVICVDDTEGIWWELAHVRSRQQLDKTLLLVHPRHMNVDANARLLEKLSATFGIDAEVARGLFAPATGRAGKPATVIGFFIDHENGVQILRSSTFSAFAYLLTLRLFLQRLLAAKQAPVAVAGRAAA